MGNRFTRGVYLNWIEERSSKAFVEGSSPSTPTISAEHSYVLGMMFTDGSLGLRRGQESYIGVYSTDYQIMEDLRLAIDTDRPIFRMKKATATTKEAYGLTLIGREMATWRARGVKRKDFLTLEGLDLHLKDFLRGHLDGDGSIQTRLSKDGKVILSSVILLGRPPLMEEIAERLRKIGFKAPTYGIKREKRIPLVVIQLAGLDGYQFLESVYYEGCFPALKRKMERARSLVRVQQELPRMGRGVL